MTEVIAHPQSAGLIADPLTPTVFHEPWWLDIATGGRYEVAEVCEQGTVVGRMPYFLQKKKLGLKVVDLPPLTHFVGPAVVEGDGKANTRFSRRLDITKELIAKFPKVSSFYIKCHRDITDVVAFQECGFRTGVQFTQEIPVQEPDDVWKNMKDKTRNLIRTARKGHDVVAGKDPDLFMHFYAHSIEDNKGVNNHMNVALHTQLIRSCLERGRGKIYEARAHDGTLAAAIFCAWDCVSSYYLLTSRRPEAHSGTTNLLVWEAISDAMSHHLIFDFDGFANEGAARSANTFAPVVVPRFTALRESPTMQVMRAVKSFYKQPICYY